MPQTKKATRLKKEPNGKTITLVDQGVLVVKLDLPAPKEDSVFVHLPTEPGAPKGWLLNADIDDGNPAVPEVDKTEFARECAHQESAFGVSGHYLAAIAQHRSGIVDGEAADGFGLYRFLMEEWKADWKTQGQFKFTFSETDIHDWRNQCTLFAVMAMRTLDQYVAAFSRRPSAIELYLSQLIGVEAMKLLKNDAAMTVKAALAAVGAAKMPPGPSAPDERIERYSKILGSSAAPESLQQVSARAEVELNAALIITRAQFAAVKVTELAKASESVGLGYNPNSDAIPIGTQAIAQLIVKSFAEAGFGSFQQVAALANAIAESSLNPAARSPPPERSFGLFQCNTVAGEGVGHDPEKLMQAEYNIGVIINRAKATSLNNATTLDEAVRIFVTDIERPQDKEGETIKRQAIAHKLVA